MSDVTRNTATPLTTRFGDEIYALFRIVFGSMLAMYGLQKLGFLGGNAAVLGSWPYGIAGPLEVVLGVMICVGFFARGAAFIASGEMAVAYFYTHFPKAVLPVENNGQPAVLLCFGFLLISVYGSGIWGLDSLRSLAVRKPVPGY